MTRFCDLEKKLADAEEARGSAASPRMRPARAAAVAAAAGGALALWLWRRRRRAAPRPVEGIIFDLDGTLIDYEGASHVALSRPLERRGLPPLGWDLHATIVGTKVEDWSAALVRARGVAHLLTPEQYAAEYFEEVEGLCVSIPKTPESERI